MVVRLEDKIVGITKIFLSLLEEKKLVSNNKNLNHFKDRIFLLKNFLFSLFTKYNYKRTLKISLDYKLKTI